MAHKALRKARRDVPRSRKAWAIVKDGKIVVHDDKAVPALLVFDTKSRADCAVWKTDERVVRVTITPA